MRLRKIHVFDRPKMKEVAAYKVVASDALGRTISAFRDFPLHIERWQFHTTRAETVYEKNKRHRDLSDLLFAGSVGVPMIPTPFGNS